MTIFQEIIFHIKKEAILEWRQKYAIGGILLYVSTTVFIVYLSFVKVQPEVWNILFWIISLFASVNAVVKSFIQENSARQLFYYQLSNPTAVIFSKIIYNIVILLMLNILAFITLALMVGNPVLNTPQYFFAILLGSIGFSITFTFISAIAAKAQNAATMMAILSFPVVIPILISVIKLSKNAIWKTDMSWTKEITNLAAIDLILLALCFLLFPFLWRD
jgi:heme exporter protein B